MRAFIGVIGALICDGIIAFGGAWLLWETGVTSVADAPTMTYVIVVLATAFLVLIRYAILGRGRRRAAAVEWVLLGDVVLTALLAAIWLVDSNYYIGWIACYCSILLLVMGIFELFGVAAGRATVDIKNVVRADFIRFFVVIGAVGGLAATTGVHYWSLSILNAALLTAATGIGIGVVGRVVLFRGRTETSQEIVESAKPATQPFVTASADDEPVATAPSVTEAVDGRSAEPQVSVRESKRRRAGGSRTIDASTV